MKKTKVSNIVLRFCDNCFNPISDYWITDDVPPKRLCNKCADEVTYYD